MLTVAEPIETPRLVLRALRASDVDDVHRFASDPEVVRYLPWQVRSREEVQAWVSERMRETELAAEGDALVCALERRADGVVIGAVNAWWRSVAHRQGEIGYVLARQAHGQGYAFEATSALLDALFERLDLHRAYVRLDARNAASAALLRRLGMRQEAHLRENELFKGEWGDELVFAVLRREWDARATAS